MIRINIYSSWFYIITTTLNQETKLEIIDNCELCNCKIEDQTPISLTVKGKPSNLFSLLHQLADMYTLVID